MMLRDDVVQALKRKGWRVARVPIAALGANTDGPRGFAAYLATDGAGMFPRPRSRDVWAALIDAVVVTERKTW
jgi:hypothetical protein